MAKGKTNQPIAIMVTPEMMTALAIQKLIDQGHSVRSLPRECMAVDLVIGLHCHMMTGEMLDRPGIMTAALKAARKRKKGKNNEH